MNPFSNFKKDFQGKRVLIFGLGLLGRGVDVVKIFVEIGCKVTVTDRKDYQKLKISLDKLKGLPINYTIGKHQQQDIDNAEIIVRNPDIDWQHDLLKRARKQKKTIIMDSSLFAKYFTGTLIGVTGTRGKTTTTHMIYKVIKASGKKDVFLAGNSTIQANLRILKKSNKNTIAIAELSSYELQGFREEKISPHISVVTNIYQDHLDHYQSLEEYIRDKEEIFVHQNNNDFLVINQENPHTVKIGKKAKSKVIWFSKDTLNTNWTLKLFGEHNYENAAASYLVGRILHVRKDLIRNCLESFKGVKHRLQIIGDVNGVKYIDDSFSTTPIATIKAIEAFPQPIILLIGGNDKQLSLQHLAKVVIKNIKGVVYLKGNGTDRLKREINKIGKVEVIAKNFNFEQSIRKAAREAQKGDIVLLSPAFTSYGEFNNVLERGEKFVEIIQSLKRKYDKKKEK